MTEGNPGIKRSLQDLNKYFFSHVKFLMRSQWPAYLMVSIAWVILVNVFTYFYPYLYLFITKTSIAGRVLQWSDLPSMMWLLLALSTLCLYLSWVYWRTSFYQLLLLPQQGKDNSYTMSGNAIKVVICDLLAYIPLVLGAIAVFYYAESISRYVYVLLLPLWLYSFPLSLKLHDEAIIKGKGLKLFSWSIWSLKGEGTTILVVYIASVLLLLPLLMLSLPVITLSLSDIMAQQGHLMLGDPILLPKYFTWFSSLIYGVYAFLAAFIINYVYLSYYARHKKLP